MILQEEWRRQLLVDYVPHTNMSICMLCYTTFKSYDGPRKNTYVKHAKRFHPALEEYTDQERDTIIQMYERYHKVDHAHLRKEGGRSFRYVFKKMKICFIKILLLIILIW